MRNTDKPRICGCGLTQNADGTCDGSHVKPGINK